MPTAGASPRRRTTRGPEVVEQWTGDGPAEDLVHPIGEGREQRLVGDLPVLVGDLARPVVELDRDGTQLAVPDGRHPDGRVLRDVVVHDEIERDAAARPRDARGREVLDPDTRME
jgi:hypothetical protein